MKRINRVTAYLSAFPGPQLTKRCPAGGAADQDGYPLVLASENPAEVRRLLLLAVRRLHGDEVFEPARTFLDSAQGHNQQLPDWPSPAP